jgi:hypothetical protein
MYNTGTINWRVETSLVRRTPVLMQTWRTLSCSRRSRKQCGTRPWTRPQVSWMFHEAMLDLQVCCYLGRCSYWRMWIGASYANTIVQQLAYQSGPRGGGMSNAMNPLIQMVCPACSSFTMYCSTIRKWLDSSHMVTRHIKKGNNDYSLEVDIRWNCLKK